MMILERWQQWLTIAGKRLSARQTERKGLKKEYEGEIIDVFKPAWTNSPLEAQVSLKKGLCTIN